ncbi:MAG: serine/threonine-protein kinase [Victivallales bacterium]
MNYVNFFTDKFFELLRLFFCFIQNIFDSAVQAGLSPEWGHIVFTSIFLAFILGSPFAAATLAEISGKNRLLHFFLGLLIPWAYPVYMFVKLARKPARTLEEKAAEEEVTGEEGSSTGEVPESHLKYEYENAMSDTSPELAPAMNQQYFARIASDEAGNPLGPFILELADGRVVEVSKISNAMPDFVILEVIEGGRSNTIRFPYAKIKTCREEKYSAPSDKAKSNPLETKTISFKEAGISATPMKKDAYNLREGDIIGNNRIIKKIGQGGMCAVYLATHTILDTPVALKLVSSKMLGPEDSEAARRFLREAKYVAKIKHPNVVPVMDAGRDDTRGFYYIALEYMDGGTVGDIIRTYGAMDEKESLKIILAAANAMSIASQFDIVHRDIKPDNIMLSKDGLVKLADLGLAKEMKTEATFTEAHEILGSPAYMSPEQIRDFRNVDIRADIYSLGATLYHMVVGKPAFEGETSVNVLMKALNEPVPNPKTLRPDLSPQVEQLIIKMMDKDPARRYQTPAELIEAITVAANEINA